jgi:N-acetylmuramoyl-L-alanine amidase
VDSQSINSTNKNLLSAVNTIAEEELSMESELLAKSVMSGMKDKIGKDIPCRGIKQESWFVVRNAKMPSILIEIGFVTNPKEGELLSSASYLQKISDGIYNGIKDFIYTFEHSEKK